MEEKEGGAQSIAERGIRDKNGEGEGAFFGGGIPFEQPVTQVKSAVTGIAQLVEKGPDFRWGGFGGSLLKCDARQNGHEHRD